MAQGPTEGQEVGLEPEIPHNPDLTVLKFKSTVTLSSPH